jgi:hypothetical protein
MGVFVKNNEKKLSTGLSVEREVGSVLLAFSDSNNSSTAE